jgi:hypothetical protein
MANKWLEAACQFEMDTERLPRRLLNSLENAVAGIVAHNRGYWNEATHSHELRQPEPASALALADTPVRGMIRGTS